MSALRRTRSGSFREEPALALAPEGMAADERRSASWRVWADEDLLPGLAAIAIDQPLAERLGTVTRRKAVFWPVIIFLFLPREMW